MATEPAHAIDVENLTKRYGELLAVDDISFHVRTGEVFAFLGPNGAGKTTTVEIIETIRPPTSGTVRLLGMDVTRRKRDIVPRIGVLPQGFSSFDRITVRETIQYYARLFSRRNTDVDGLIELAHLEDKSREQFKNLSGGLKQRLGIAIALVNDPEVVFLDEPTTGLDPQARRNLWDVIRSINQEHGKTVVLTTHYLEEAEELCERVAIMDEARIVALDTPAGLIATLDADARVSYTDASGDHTVYVRDAQTTVLEILERARQSGDAVENLGVRGADLEDVFMQLTGREYRE